jgi:hypothetical protein
MHASVAMTFHIREEVPETGLYHIRAWVFFEENIAQGTIEVALEL